jgi:hypothetical protein
MIGYRPATLDDCSYVGEHMRELDRLELYWTGARDPVQTLRQSVGLSDGYALTALVGGVPAAIFGIAPNYLLGDASPWMLGTDAVTPNRRELVAATRRMTTYWLSQFPLLLNEVWMGNEPAVRFLKHAGFEFAKPRTNEYGADVSLFYMRRD